MTSSDSEYCCTLIIQVAVTKLDALAIVALAVDRPISGAGSVHPFIELEGGARVEIEIPKFGEPPPLALDVYSTLSQDHAAMSALALLAALEAATSWAIKPDFVL
ncbi:MAG: hypothetical protein EPO52_07355 [Herbiconiux sp.]|uniref:hypothetical protein n=1 Tax=Herbiconiux sp. TaxID=1871186 RepID=UPI0012119B95|nr:hypothetical protein [Herbiconiux sp.]TAJ47989.1 MAG: hypothetical protein EPO52_07355 [Herbiconiux sp.]